MECRVTHHAQLAHEVCKRVAVGNDQHRASCRRYGRLIIRAQGIQFEQIGCGIGLQRGGLFR